LQRKSKYTFYVEQSFFENFTVYEIMWTNNLEPTGHRWQYGACAFHGRNLRLHSRAQNM